MAEKKGPLPGNTFPAEKNEKGAPPENTYPKEVWHQQLAPSAPSMDFFRPLELPPSYAEACVTPKEAAPVPYYVPLQAGKGCVLLLHFPCPDVDQVGQYFKRNVPNMLLHNGKVLAFLPQVSTFPSHPLSALIIYFDAQRIALSWLQNMMSSNPEVTSRWLAMVTENKTVCPKPGNLSQYSAISIVLMKRKAEFTADKAYTDEQAKLWKEASNPVKTKYGVLSIVSGCPVFACGDWSSFPAKANELLVNITQHKNLETRSAYTREHLHDPKLKRSNELTVQKYSFLLTAAFPTGDIGKFQDL